jgi:hypothetical protein
VYRALGAALPYESPARYPAGSGCPGLFAVSVPSRKSSKRITQSTFF